MLFIFSCDKDGNITSLDELEQKEYYESEIFDEAHLDIYESGSCLMLQEDSREEVTISLQKVTYR